MSKNSVINLIAQIFLLAINLCISFFLIPYISKTIGVSAYGFVGLSNDFINYAQLVTIALNSMASRFITIKIHEKNIDEANKFYSSVILTNVLLSIILLIIGAVFVFFIDSIINVPSNLLMDVRILFILMFANFIISVLTSTFSIATFCTNKLYLSSIKTMISQIIKAVLLLLLFSVFSPSVYYVGVASLISTIYLGFCNYRYSKSLTPELQISFKYFRLSSVKQLFFSGIWNTISKLSSILSNGLDLLITNLFVGSVGMGIISCTKTIPNAILNAFGTISNAFAPELTIHYAKKEKQKMQNQLIYAIKILGLFASVPLVILFSYGKEFYSLWIPNQDSNVLYILTCVSVLGLCFSSQLEPLWNIFTITNKVKNSSLFILMNSILNIVIVFISLQFTSSMLIRMLIIVGVSAIISVIRSLTFLPMYGAKCLDLKLNVFYPPIIKNFVIIFISVIISSGFKYIFDINSWLMLIIASCLSVVISITLSIFITISKNERKQLITNIEKILKRRKNENC